VSINTLKLWRKRKAFPPLIILPTGQARYSEFQIMTFSPEAVRYVAKEKLRETAPRPRKAHSKAECDVREELEVLSLSAGALSAHRQPGYDVFEVTRLNPTD
jgi:hypothetical protein